MSPYLKAVIGALVAGLTALQASLDDGGITVQEGIGAAVAFVVALAAVWAVPNTSTREP